MVQMLWLTMYTITHIAGREILAQEVVFEVKMAVAEFQRYAGKIKVSIIGFNPERLAEDLDSGLELTAAMGIHSIHVIKQTASPDTGRVLRPVIERWLDTLDRTKPQRDLPATLAKIFGLGEEHAVWLLDEISKEQARAEAQPDRGLGQKDQSNG